MIRINRQTDYALRVLLVLAKQDSQERVPTSLIQREMHIPKAFSLRVVSELAKGGFIRTYPGREGGLKLARPAKEINLRQVVDHFETTFYVSECLLDSDTCPLGEKCPVRCRWAHLQALILAELERTTFDELAREAAALPQLVSPNTVPFQAEANQGIEV